MSRLIISADDVRARLDYDPITGVFTRRSGRGSPIGSIVGRLSTKGYIEIELLGSRHRAHRLAWVHYYGVPPTCVVDHINGVKTDNRIENLRDVPFVGNAQNRRLAASGLGVSWNKQKQRWVANIQVPTGKQLYLGAFETKSAAQDAYIAAKRLHHVYCTI